MEIFYEVDADQIEVGDQVIIYGEPVEVTGIVDDVDDIIVISGFSHTTGDKEIYTVGFNDTFEVWGV